MIITYSDIITSISLENSLLWWFVFVVICFHKRFVWKLKCTAIFLILKRKSFTSIYTTLIFICSTQLFSKAKLGKWHTRLLLQNICVKVSLQTTKSMNFSIFVVRFKMQGKKRVVKPTDFGQGWCAIDERTPYKKCGRLDFHENIKWCLRNITKDETIDDDPPPVAIEVNPDGFVKFTVKGEAF